MLVSGFTSWPDKEIAGSRFRTNRNTPCTANDNHKRENRPVSGFSP
ncbi:hypothetical protein FVER14953_21650 [Fusarium verticillioides]|nr:hypothetical protein FVER14953_21650 [Fusarium verticillioides]